MIIKEEGREEEYVTLQELSKNYYHRIGISYPRLRGLIHEGFITDIKRVGNIIIVPLEKTLQMLEERKRYINERNIVEKRIREYFMSKNPSTPLLLNKKFVQHSLPDKETMKKFPELQIQFQI